MMNMMNLTTLMNLVNLADVPDVADASKDGDVPDVADASKEEDEEDDEYTLVCCDLYPAILGGKVVEFMRLVEGKSLNQATRNNCLRMAATGKFELDDVHPEAYFGYSIVGDEMEALPRGRSRDHARILDHMLLVLGWKPSDSDYSQSPDGNAKTLFEDITVAAAAYSVDTLRVLADHDPELQLTADHAIWTYAGGFVHEREQAMLPGSMFGTALGNLLQVPEYAEHARGPMRALYRGIWKARSGSYSASVAVMDRVKAMLPPQDVDLTAILSQSPW